MNSIAEKVKPAPHKSGGRLDFIDIGRGIAACIVLLQHAFEASGFLDPSNGFGTKFINFGQAGVVTFFLISGFVIPLGLEKWHSIKHFAIGRAARIYPLYLFIFTINAFALNAHGFLSFPTTEQILTLAQHIFFLQEYIGKKNFVGASWTLSVEAVWYVIFAGLFYFKKNKSTSFTVLMLSFLALTPAVASVALETRIPLGRINLLLLCSIGLLTYRHFTGNINTKYFLIYTSIAGVAIAFSHWVAFFHFSHQSLSATAATSSWLLGTAIFFLLYINRTKKAPFNTTAINIGTYSYSIYLLHPLFISILGKINIPNHTLLIAILATTFFASYFTYKYIETPFLKIASRYRSKDIAI